MTDPPVAVTVYHNPSRGMSRNTMALIRNAGIEPTVIEYLKTPPDRAMLRSLLGSMGIRPGDLLREKARSYAERGLGAPHWTDERLIDRTLAIRFSSTDPWP